MSNLGNAPRLLLQPTFLLYVALGLAIANLWRKRKESRGRLLLVVIPFLLLSLTCTRATGYFAHAALEWPYSASDEVPGDAQAIVVLSGYARGPDGILPRPELGSDTLYRCVHAARLHQKAKNLPVLVTGGPIEGTRPAMSIAQFMKDFLVDQGVEKATLIVEGLSRNTYENAVESSKLLRERGIRRIVLVTDAEHMLRASACFRKQGMEVSPSPVRNSETLQNNLDDYLPNPREAGDFELATLEWEKIVYYWLRGRL
jgi:uncharacterized SAM-binding protein YcdF (DUF218 family)